MWLNNSRNMILIFTIMTMLMSKVSASVLPSPTLITPAKENDDQAYFKQFQDIFSKVEKYYVQDDIDKKKMFEGAINGMLNSLDPHSSYLADEEFEDFMSQTKGEFGGIGVEIMPESAAIKVISPIDDLPAYKAGIKSGDYIIAVNGKLVSTLGPAKAVKEMRGEIGTKVKLVVFKESEGKQEEIELTREIVKVKPIKAKLEGENIAYIKVVSFSESTFSDLKKEFEKLQTTTNQGIKGIILDLRHNPGGLLDQAVAMSDYFLPKGTIVSTKSRYPAQHTFIEANPNTAKAPNIPIVILIDEGTASASEIVAGALQDHKRALILGKKSFGKGSVQTLMQLNNCAALKLTTAKYYTPSGKSIQAEGIEPDIIIETAKVDYSERPENKWKITEAQLKNYLKNDENKKEENNLKDKDKDKEKDKNKDKDKDKDKNSTNAVKVIDSKNKDKDSKNKEIKEEDNKEKPILSELYKKDYQFARAFDLIRGLILTAEFQSCKQ